MDYGEFSKIVENHKRWLTSKGEAGIQADFTKYLGDEFWTDDNRRIIIQRKKFDLDCFIFNKIDLRQAKLAHVSLQGASLINTQFQNANLQSANLNGVTAVNANFEDANLDNASLQGVDLRSSKILGATLRNTNLQGACLDGLDLRKINLQGANLTGASLIGTILNAANLSKAILNDCSMQGALLDHANLEGASLLNVQLESANLQDANLRLSHIENAKFIFSVLDGVIFQRAEIHWVKFNSASLITANFRGAVLDDVDFSSIPDGRTTTLHYAKFDDAEEIESKIEINAQTNQPEMVETTKVFPTEINVTWGDADVTSITISQNSISKLPQHLFDLYGNTFNNFALRYDTITRSIEFPKGYEQAGLGILSYFGKIVREKYRDINVQVSIKQIEDRITMVIETPEGTRETIEKTLQD